eukprot:6178877-Pleurochrysis_carterae.AAC.10
MSPVPACAQKETGGGGMAVVTAMCQEFRKQPPPTSHVSCEECVRQPRHIPIPCVKLSRVTCRDMLREYPDIKKGTAINKPVLAEDVHELLRRTSNVSLLGVLKHAAAAFVLCYGAVI